jgi:ribosomal protein L34E
MPVDRKQIERAVRLRRAGKSIKDVLRAVPGVSRASLFRALKDAAPPSTAPADGDLEVADIAEIDALIAQCKQRLAKLPRDSVRFGPIAATLGGLLERRRRMRPTTAERDGEEDARRRVATEATRTAIEKYVTALERQADAAGVCVRCGQPVGGLP